MGASLFTRDLRGPRLAHNTGGRRVLKTPCCLRRRRAAGRKRNARYGRAHANPDRCFRTFRIHAIYGATWFVGNHRSKLERGLSQHFRRRQIRCKAYRGLAAPSKRLLAFRNLVPVQSLRCRLDPIVIELHKTKVPLVLPIRAPKIQV